MVATRVAEGLAIQVSNKKCDERGKSRLHRRQVGIACLAVSRLYQREFRQRDQDLTNSLDDLLLIRRRELSQTERMVLHLLFARTAEVEFVVRLDRDGRQKGYGHQNEQA